MKNNEYLWGFQDIPNDEDEMFSLTRVVGQAIQGQDCAERLACELGRAIRTMKLGQKPLRYYMLSATSVQVTKATANMGAVISNLILS